MDPEAGAATAPEITSIISNLRQHLQMPKRERPKDWDAQVSPLVALVSVDYPKQEDEHRALEELALIALADALGVKEAKRRTRSPRIATEPPSLTTLPAIDERKAVVKDFARARPTWGTAYAVQSFGHLEARAYRNELIDLAQRSAKSWADVLHEIQRKSGQLGLAVGEAIRAFADSARAPGSTTPLGESFLDALMALVGPAKQMATEPGGEKHGFLALGALVDFVDVGLSVEPRLALHPSVGELLGSLSAGKKQPKAYQRRLEFVAFRLVKILTCVYSLATPEARKEVSSLMSASAKASSMFLDQVERATQADPSLKSLLGAQGDGLPQSLFPIEEALCSLIPEIDALSKRLPEDAEVRQISTRVDAIAAAVQVDRLGHEGDIQRFEPFHHLLVQDTTPMPRNVRIEKAGLIVTRTDGSRRVLLKAIVSPVAP